MYFLDELGNLHRPSVVSQSDRVPRQTRELVEQRDQALEVLLDGKVERITVLEVGGHVQDAAHVVEGQQLAAGSVHATEVAAEEDAEDCALHLAGPRVAVLVVRVLRGGFGEGLDGGDLLVDTLASGGQDIGDWCDPSVFMHDVLCI